LEDWADAIVKLTHNEQDGDTGPRYISAVGRDIELEEDRLSFDPATRWLSLSGGGSRKEAEASRRDEDTRQDIVRALRDQLEGLSGKALADACGDRKDADFTRVRNAMVADGYLLQSVRSGRGGGQVYALNPQTCRTYPKPTTTRGNTEPVERTEHTENDPREYGWRASEHAEPYSRQVQTESDKGNYELTETYRKGTEPAPSEPTEPPLIGGGSGSVRSEAQPAESPEPRPSSAHHCCDCGQPIPGGFVRCQPCRRRAGL